MIRLLQGATILEVFYKRGSTLFNEDVLDFHHIKEQLQQHCSSTIAKELAMNIEPMIDAKQIQENLDETAEAMRSLQTEVEQPLGGTRDIRESCKKSRKDFVLTREALWDIYLTIGAYKRMTKFFRTKYMEYPLLSLWVQDMPNTDRIENRFKRVFDDKGNCLIQHLLSWRALEIRLLKLVKRLKMIFKLSYTTRIIRSISKKQSLHSVIIAM